MKVAARRFWSWIRDTRFAEGVVALFTAALTLASVYQFIVVNGQLDVMQKDQRAWITAVPGDPAIPQTGAGKPLSIPLTLTNTGKTVARDVHVEVVVNIVNNGELPKCEYGEKILEVRRTTKVFLPNATRTFNTALLRAPETDKATAQPRNLTDDEFKQLSDGRMFYVIYGRASYKDMFKKEHWVHFCSFGKLDDSKIVMLTSKACVDYNDLDDN